MNFKETINKDLQHVFFNTNEFAEQHTLNGISVEVIMDNDRLKERSKKSMMVYTLVNCSFLFQ